MNTVPTIIDTPENLQGSLYTDPLFTQPKETLLSVIAGLNLGDELQSEFNRYFQGIQNSSNPRDNAHQVRMQNLLEELLSSGKKEEAGLMFNIHRILTEYSGYGANENPSSDVETCFGDGAPPIPNEGLIVIEFFATRNLPKILSKLSEKGVDLSRVRVAVPQGILAAQLMGMSADKKKAMETVFQHLNPKQFLAPNVNHVSDISINGQIAVLFGPRVRAINPKLHAETEEETIENYINEFRTRMGQIVPGGIVYSHLAYSEIFTALETENVELDPTPKGGRNLVKIPGVSKGVAVAVGKVFLDAGFRQHGKNEINPREVNTDTDHAKIATALHMVKPTGGPVMPPVS